MGNIDFYSFLSYLSERGNFIQGIANLSIIWIALASIRGYFWKNIHVKCSSLDANFKIRYKDTNIQSLTNFISYKFYDGGILPPDVRKELIDITTPQIKGFNQESKWKKWYDILKKNYLMNSNNSECWKKFELENEAYRMCFEMKERDFSFDNIMKVLSRKRIEGAQISENIEEDVKKLLSKENTEIIDHVTIRDWSIHLKTDRFK